MSTVKLLACIGHHISGNAVYTLIHSNIYTTIVLVLQMKKKKQERTAVFKPQNLEGRGNGFEAGHVVLEPRVLDNLLPL